MCYECGCQTLGSTLGAASVRIQDVSNGQMEYAEESAAHEMAEGMVDPD